MSGKRNLLGHRSGSLLVQQETAQRKNKNVVWECLCDCGELSYVPGGDLTSGKVQKCGNYKKHRSLDMVGQRFGDLLVLSIHDEKLYGKNIFYRCLCLCGNDHITSGKKLRKGETFRCTKCANKEIARKNTTHGRSKTKEYANALTKARKEKKKEIDSKWTPEMERALIALQSICVVCGSTDRLAIDHVLPLSKGHGLIPGNAVRLCIGCNSSKRNKDLENMPLDIATKIKNAAEQFRDCWEVTSKII